MSKEPESKHDTRYGESRANPHPTPTPTPEQQAATDVAADAQKMLLLLTADWLDNDRTHAGEIAVLLAGIVANQGPPAVVDVPLVFQEGAILHCTMGNWDGEPTGYTYAWHTDGVANGQTGAEHAVTEDDVGQDWACVVTATNKLGSTVAPMSNSVTVAEAPPA